MLWLRFIDMKSRTSFAKRMCSRYPCLCLHAKSAHTIVIYATSFIHLTNVRGHHIPSVFHKMSVNFQLFFTRIDTNLWQKCESEMNSTQHVSNNIISYKQTVYLTFCKPEHRTKLSVCCFLRKCSEFAIRTNSLQINETYSMRMSAKLVALFVELFYFL